MLNYNLKGYIPQLEISYTLNPFWDLGNGMLGFYYLPRFMPILIACENLPGYILRGMLRLSF